MQNRQRIGIFDSGIGGLSVLNEICQLLPNEDIVYLADSAHAPYGNKSHEFILQRCDELTQFLIEQDCKAIVIACNTATAVSVKALREKYPLPIIAMEPGVKPSIAATRTGVVGVLATENTLASQQFESLLHRYAADVRVISQPCPGLVEEIETGDFESDRIHQLLKQYTQPLLEAGADTIVLGCTHFPLVRELIAEQVGSGISLIDTGAAVAQQLKRRLDEMSLHAEQTTSAKLSLFTSGESDRMTPVINKIVGQQLVVAELPEIKNPA